VSVQFLSTEWAEALKAHLNGNDAFTQAAQGQNATIQQVITGGDGETLYFGRAVPGQPADIFVSTRDRTHGGER